MSRPRLWVAGGALLLAAGLGASCPDPFELEPGAHSWGTFELCLRRVSDTCREAGKPCATPALDATRTMTLALRADGRTLLLSRAGLPPLEGVQRGDAIEATTQGGATVCGCSVTVTERIRATLSPQTVAALACEGAPDAGAGCGAPDGGPSDGGPANGTADGGEAPDAGAGADLDASYHSLRGTIVDDVEPVSCPSGTAGCAPCRVEYELTGRR